MRPIVSSREQHEALDYPVILAPGGQPYTEDYFRAIGEQAMARDPELRAKALAWESRQRTASGYREVSLPIDVLKNYYAVDWEDDDPSGAEYLLKMQDTLQNQGWGAFKNLPSLEVGAAGQHAVLSDGNHRVRAADGLGMTHVPVNLVTGEDDNWAAQYGKPVEDGLRQHLSRRTARGFPKTQKCKYCAEQATQRIIHSEGMAYVPVCDEHLEKGKDAAATCTPDGTRDDSNIDRIDKVATAPVVDDTDFEEDESEEAPYEPDFGLYNKFKDAWSSGGNQGEFPPWFETAGDGAYSDEAYELFSDFLQQIDDDEWADWEQAIYNDDGKEIAYSDIQKQFHNYLNSMGVHHLTQAEAKQAQWEEEALEEAGEYIDGYYGPGPGFPDKEYAPIIPSEGEYGRRYFSPTAINPESASSARPWVDFEEHDFEQDPLPLPGVAGPGERSPLGGWDRFNEYFDPPTDPDFIEWANKNYDFGDKDISAEDFVGSGLFKERDGHSSTDWRGLTQRYKAQNPPYQWPKNRSTELYRGRQVDLTKPEFAQIRRMLYGPDREFEEYDGALGLEKAQQPGQVAPAGGWDNPELGALLLDALEQTRRSGPGGLGKHWSTSRNTAEQFAGQSGYSGGDPMKLQVMLTNSWGGQGEDPYRTNTGGDFPDENEITMLNGAPVNVTSVEIRNPAQRTWHSVLPEPSARTAAILAAALGGDLARKVASRRKR